MEKRRLESRRRSWVLAVMGVAILPLFLAMQAGAAPAPVTNPNYNDGCPPAGPVTGWTTSVTAGSWVQTNVGPAPFPFEGTCSAVGTTGGSAAGAFQIITSTTFNAGAGMTLTGWARFLDGEEGGGLCDPSFGVNDLGQVRLLRLGPTEGLFTVHQFSSTTQGPDSGWVRWSARTPSPGAWAIRYQVANGSDSLCGSTLLADTNSIGSVSIVPKP
jgi:hypothetical protein